MKKSYRSRFKKVWDDKDVKTNGLIHRIGEGNVDALKEEQLDVKVVEDTKRKIKR